MLLRREGEPRGGARPRCDGDTRWLRKRPFYRICRRLP